VDANLGTGHMHLNVKAVAYIEAQHALATSLKLAHVQSDAALNMGVALALHFRAARQAHLAFGADQEDAALAHLKEHLSWVVQGGRDTCAGCGQTRGEDTPDAHVQRLPGSEVLQRRTPKDGV